MTHRSGRGRRLRTALVVATIVFLGSPWGSETVHEAWLSNARDSSSGEAQERPPAPGVGVPVEVGSPAAEAVAAKDAGPGAAAPPAAEHEMLKTGVGTRSGTWRVTNVVDGDTIDVVDTHGTSHRVRLIGMDTPERGMCGFAESSDMLAGLVLDSQVELSPGAVDDRDRYGRLLRYVDHDGIDAGLALIERGMAIARYDSRDGYGPHPREDSYVAADAAAPDACSTGAPPAALVDMSAPAEADAAWSSCGEAHAAGASPVYRDDPRYGRHLDGDNDGAGCE